MRWGAAESAPVRQLSLHSQTAKLGHHLRTGHVKVGQHPGGVGHWGDGVVCGDFFDLRHGCESDLKSGEEDQL